MKKIIFYKKPNAEEPVIEWLNSFKDSTIKRKFLIRLRRVEQGNFGD